MIATLTALLLATGYGGDWPHPYQNLRLTRVLDGKGDMQEASLRWRRRLGGTNAPLLVDDVTGDGKTDFVTLIGGRAVCRSPVDGTLSWASPGLELGGFLTAPDGRPRDLDGDGILDVLVQKANTGDARIYALDGQSGKVSWSFGEGLGPNSGVQGITWWIGDVDGYSGGDIGPELILYVTNNTGGAFFYAFDFSKGFGAAGTLLWKSDGVAYKGSTRVVVADVTGDGVPEIAASSADALRVIRLSDGYTVALTAGGWYGSGAAAIPYGAPVVAFDADDDPAKELAIAYGGLGSAGFFAVADVDAAGVPTPRFRRDIATRWVNGPLVDLTGDGRPELVVSILDGTWRTEIVETASGTVLATLAERVATPHSLDTTGDGLPELVLVEATTDAIPTFGTLRVVRYAGGLLSDVVPGGITSAAASGVVRRGAPYAPAELLITVDPNGDGRGDALNVLDVGTAPPGLPEGSPTVVGTYLFPKDLDVFYRGSWDEVVGSEPGQLVLFSADGYFDVLNRPLNRVGDRIATGGFAPTLLTSALTPDGPRDAFVKDSVGRTLRVALATGSPSASPDATTLFSASDGRTLMSVSDLEGPGPWPPEVGLPAGDRELLVFERKDGVDAFVVMNADGETDRWRFTAPGLVGPPENNLLGIGGDVDGDGISELHALTVIDNLRVGITLDGATGGLYPWVYQPWQAIAGNGTAYSPPILHDFDGDGVADVLISRFGDRIDGVLSPAAATLQSIRILSGDTGAKVAMSNVTADPGRLVLGDIDGDEASLEIVIGSWRQLGVLRYGPAGLTTLWTQPFTGPLTRGMPMLLDLNGDSLNDLIHFDHTIGRVRARRGVDGSAIWSAPEGTLASEVQLSGGRAFWIKQDGTGFIDVASGELLASVPMVSLNEAAAAVTDLTGLGHPTLLFGGGDGRAYALNGATGQLDFVYDVGFSIGNIVPTDLEGDGIVEVLLTAGDGNLYALGRAADLGTIAAVRDGLGADVDEVDTAASGIDTTRFSANWDAPTGGTEPVKGYFVRLLTETGALVLDWTDVGDVSSASIIAGAGLVSGLTYVVLVLPYGDGGSGRVFRSDGFVFRDSDGDRLIDSDEERLGTDPLNHDTDGDRIPDGVETNFGANIDTDGDGLLDALDDDSDADGVLDQSEGTTDTDEDGTPDFRDTDDDGDGIDTAVEYVDSATWGSDVDGDGRPNWLDTESDGDGAADRQEGRADQDLDGVPDYLDRYLPEAPVEVDDDLGATPEPPSGDAVTQVAVIQTYGGTETESAGGCSAGGATTPWPWAAVGVLLALLRRWRRVCR
ncbi:MAG: hypothetical protein IV100_18695 [Myxococcales bacterium]|nr:hypothetical protein [Myxococcales bacterium]